MNKSKEQELLLNLRRKTVAMDEVFNTISQFSWRISQSRYKKSPTSREHILPELDALNIAILWEKQRILKDISNYLKENSEELDKLQKILFEILTTAEEEIILGDIEEVQDGKQ